MQQSCCVTALCKDAAGSGAGADERVQAPATGEPIGGGPGEPGQPMGTFGGSKRMVIRSLRAPVCVRVVNV